MRLLHTSDWHLGRSLHEAVLLEEQAYALDQLVAMAKEYRPDLLIVAGDVYDRALPPAEAVELLDDTLTRLALDAKVEILIIPGNHDSAARLSFGSRLLRAQGVTVIGKLPDSAAPLLRRDEFGPVEIHAIPYVEPAEARAWLGREDLRGHDEAWRGVLARLFPEGLSLAGLPADGRPQPRRILAAHAFVAGGLEGESERPLSLGGSGAVGADAFTGFAYVALGHLHRPQRVGEGPLWYSGSLCKYAFSEAPQKKGALLVDIDGKGAATVQALPFAVRRDVRRVEGLLEDLLHAPPSGGREDYIEAVLADEMPQLHALERLRAVYPNLLHIQRPNLIRATEGRVGLRGDHRRLEDLDLFREFLKQVHQRALRPEEESAFLKAVAAAQTDGDANP